MIVLNGTQIYGAIQGSHYFWALPQDFYYICLISCAAIKKTEPSKAQRS